MAAAEPALLPELMSVMGGPEVVVVVMRPRPPVGCDDEATTTPGEDAGALDLDLPAWARRFDSLSCSAWVGRDCSGGASSLGGPFLLL